MARPRLSPSRTPDQTGVGWATRRVAGVPGDSVSVPGWAGSPHPWRTRHYEIFEFECAGGVVLGAGTARGSKKNFF